MTIFILGGGVFWDTLDLDSVTIFIGGGGILGHLRFGLSDNFHFGGRGVFYRIGVFCGIWTKISTTPAGSCITDSLSHTTYVETNKKTRRRTQNKIRHSYSNNQMLNRGPGFALPLENLEKKRRQIFPVREF